jgi:tRNA(fMet)-specific endonuclease VapC
MLQYLLDTNIAIYVIKHRPPHVREAFNQQHGRMAISAITLAELVHGAEKNLFVSRNLGVVEDFCSRLSVLAYPAEAAHHYGSIRAALERQGTPIGVNGLHIAAHARSSGLTLVTNNLKEFERVPGLLMENWLAQDVSRG